MSSASNGHVSRGGGPPHHHSFPTTAVILARLREVYGPEQSGHDPVARWVIPGASPGRDVVLHMDRNPPVPRGNGAEDDGASVIWVTRPGEARPERCPIVTLQHLEAFLAMVTIARRSPEPVHGNVCPGTE